MIMLLIMHDAATILLLFGTHDHVKIMHDLDLILILARFHENSEGS